MLKVERQHVLIQHYTEPVIQKLEELDKKLDFILNTHHHNDHVGANLQLQKKYKCEIVGNEKDKARIPGISIL